MDIIAGESGEGYDLVAGDGVPGHVQVLRDHDVDEARYAEAELSDTELLALAAEDAMDAANAGDIAGGPLDELELRRVRRSRRRAVAGALRTSDLGVAS